MSKYQVKVPSNYEPSLKVTFYSSRNCWRYKFILPCDGRVYFVGYISKKKVKTKRDALKFRDLKRDSLLKGYLNEKEYSKLQEFDNQENLTFDVAIEKYIDLTRISKSPRTIKADREVLPIVFSYFEKKFGFVYLKQIKEVHLNDYKEYLLSEALKRKEKIDTVRPVLENCNTDEERSRLSKLIRETGIAPSTAHNYFKFVRKFFNKLYEAKKISYNPAKEVRAIQICQSDRVRKRTFDPSDIVKISKCNYKHKFDFPLVLFVLFLAETGAREGEALHFEWTDFDENSSSWMIKEKPDCPTIHRVGWKPKWGKERKIFLSESAKRILRMIPREDSVGYVRVRYEDKKDFVKEPVPANFVFTAKDYQTGKRRRVDSLSSSWKALLKVAEVGEVGFNQFTIYDFRRYKNVINECVHNMTVKERSEELGNSERVNTTHYAGEIGGELEKMKARIEELTARNLELQAEIKQLKKVS